MPASSRARSGGAVSATVPRAEAAARSAARSAATAAAGVPGTGPPDRRVPVDGAAPGDGRGAAPEPRVGDTPGDAARGIARGGASWGRAAPPGRGRSPARRRARRDRPGRRVSRARSAG